MSYIEEDESITKVVIPEFVIHNGKKYKVTSLGKECFMDCSTLTSIEIPESVTSLGELCFRDCSALTSIKIPTSVKSLECGCFWGCSALTSIELPKSLTSLGMACFIDCSALTSIDLPESLTNLHWFCFLGCSALTSIKIPASITSIGKRCFKGCSALEAIMVDTNNPKYDSREDCNAIIETESNTMIAGCKNTRIPTSVTSLKSFCFYQQHLTSIEIPTSVTSLEYACFGDCSTLTSIEIPKTVTNLGKQCFYGCSALTSIEIPASVTSLGIECFLGCFSLESIVVKTNNPQYDSREDCNAIIETKSNKMIAGCKNTRIPMSVTSLENGCFFCQKQLTLIDIPASVTNLGCCCFYGCENLQTVICRMENVIGDETLFYETSIEGATLYVSKELLDTYKAIAPWSGFGTILPLTEK